MTQYEASPNDSRYIPFTQQDYCCVPTSIQMIMYRNSIPLLPAEELGYNLGLTVPPEDEYLFHKARVSETPPSGAGLGTQIMNPEYNILPTSAEQIRKRGGYDMFDAEVLSCVEGIRKPDPAIYQKAVELAGCLPEECIFIEDQERYIVPAKEMGITTILATSPEQIIRDLKALIG